MPPPRALVLLGLLAALACGSDREPPAPAGAPAAAPADRDADLAAARLEVATLREALASEHAEREALEAEVERLRAQLEDVGLGAAEQEAGAQHADAGPDAGEKEGPWFDADGLLEHGVEPAEVDRVRESFDASELALLELEDRARREGWLGSPRYREALRDSRNALHAELGDERFDRLLYASGRKNRVVVEELLGGSPAQLAGLQPGDEILSYGSTAIFRAPELKWGITQADPRSPVAIEVLRQGNRMRLWVPYGPLGIRLSEQRRPPR